MAGKGEGYSDQPNKLEDQIGCVKYTLFCFNVVAWLFGAAMFGLTIWVRSDSGYDEWVTILNIEVYYIGIYILIGASIVIMAISFLGCVSALMENTFALLVFVGTQILGFILVCVGSAVLLDFSTVNSSVQPLIRNTMMRLIMSSEHEQAANTLKMIQENIGCCGADGPNDYILFRKPLPYECRDTITGNAFFHSCTDELTWLLEDKSGWIAGLAMSLALINVVGAVMSIVLMQAIKKEEREREYPR